MNDFFTLMKPEFLLTGILFLLLFIKLGKGIQNEKLLPVIQVLLLLNFIVGFLFNAEGNLFDGMYYTTSMIVLQKNILNLALYLISLLFHDWFKKSAHMPEYFMLMLSAVLGMFFLISSGNLLMFFLSIELATIPVAAMANFDVDKKRSSESALKLIMSAAFSSGILLFGISLIYGTTGTINFTEIPQQFTGSSLQILAFVFFFSAFAFKLSIVPFHLWTADVYEGAPMATTAFLSVVSKGAVAFILMTVLFKVFAQAAPIWYNILVILSITTLVLGNLFAIRQQNIKRFLAYSSIAQVGFILVGISAGIPASSTAVVYFVLIYVFSNLAAFGVATVISSKTNCENIDDYKGMYKTNPFISWIMALALFSLAGIPPTAGFFGKLFLLSAGAAKGSYLFIIIAALNMIIALYYYLRIIRSVFMDNNDEPLAKIKIDPTVKFGLLLCGAGIVLTGLLSWIYNYIQSVS